MMDHLIWWFNAITSSYWVFQLYDAASSNFIGFSLSQVLIFHMDKFDSKKTSILNEINNSIDYLNKDTETRPLPLRINKNA